MTKKIANKLKSNQEVYQNVQVLSEELPSGMHNFSVVADSIQFGKGATMFESLQYDKCLEYAKDLDESVCKINSLNHDRYHEDTLDTVYKWLGVKTSDDCYSDENCKQTFIKVTNNEDFGLLKESFESYHQTEVDYISLEVVTDSHDKNYFQILVCDSDGETYESAPIYFLEWKPKKSVYNKLKKTTYMDVELQD